MAKNKEGFDKGVNIEIDDLLTHQAKLRQKAKKPKSKPRAKKVKPIAEAE